MCKDHFYNVVLPRLWNPATLAPRLLHRGAKKLAW
jgi:hypothetical protein